LLPFFKGRIKEWAYAGFTFNFISAAISHTIVDGFGGQTIFPILMLGILAASYYYYYQLQTTYNPQHEQYNLSLPVV
jgi:hypothetical protein